MGGEEKFYYWLASTRGLCTPLYAITKIIRINLTLQTNTRLKLFTHADAYDLNLTIIPKDYPRIFYRVTNGRGFRNCENTNNRKRDLFD